MKQQLYTLLKQWYHDVQLEPYIEEIRQIPDLTVGRWALEIQLSPININTLQKKGLKSYHNLAITSFG